MARRIDHQDGDSHGVIGADIDLQAWSQRLDSMLSRDNALQHLLLDRESNRILVHSNPNRIGLLFAPSWSNQLIGTAGSFYASDEDEFVASSTVPDRPELMAVTIQLRRDRAALQYDAMVLVVTILGQQLLGERASLYRFGGEELVAIFEDMPLELARLTMDEWRGIASSLTWREAGMQVSFSGGIGRRNGLNQEAFFVLVDGALYRAKRTGKNRITSVDDYDDPVPTEQG